ncbi:MAG: hypothetical protein EOP49_20575 [Sphingobacteriales bacterium]|nr:MAG: hypothetical protein EOP49_20575 [Sphingobacteriales bacterium]
MNTETAKNSESIFDALYNPFVIRRKKMLPIWMKAFCFIFILFGFLAIAGIVLPIFYLSFGGIQAGGTLVSLYGLHAINEYSAKAIGIIFLYVFKAIVSIALLTEKDWAVKLGMIDGALGIGICVLTMLVLPFFGWSFRFNWELFPLFVYQARLWRMRPQWEENAFAFQEKLGLVTADA